MVRIFCFVKRLCNFTRQIRDVIRFYRWQTLNFCYWTIRQNSSKWLVRLLSKIHFLIFYCTIFNSPCFTYSSLCFFRETKLWCWLQYYNTSLWSTCASLCFLSSRKLWTIIIWGAYWFSASLILHFVPRLTSKLRPVKKL